MTKRPVSAMPDEATLLQRALVGLVDRSRRHAWFVVLVGMLLAGASGLYASRHLGINTDTDQMFAASLPWRQHAMALSRAFPQSQGLLVAVIDGDTPEAADATAQGLALALSGDHTHFMTVRRPDASPYLRKEGLLLLSVPQLTDLLNRTIDAQPFLGKLAADPSLRGLFSALSLLGQGVTSGDADLTPYLGQLRTFHTAMAAAIGGHPQDMSWQRLLSGKVGDLGGQYRFVLAQPKLDFSSLEPGGAATQAIRAAAAKLEFVRNGTAHVRITGPVALADAQFATVAQGAVAGLIGSVVLITLWLLLAGADLATDRADPGHARRRADAHIAVRRGRDRHAQSGVGRFRCAVHRHSGRFRHPVRRALPRGASRSRRCGAAHSGRPRSVPAARSWWPRWLPRRGSSRSCRPHSAAWRSLA